MSFRKMSPEWFAQGHITGSEVSGSMLLGLARMIRGSVAACRHHITATGVQTERRSSVAPQQLSSAPRDYSLPNASWTASTKETYAKYMELSKDGSWRRLPSYNSAEHHKESTTPPGISLVAGRKTRLYTRNVDGDGLGFEYCMFFNKAEKRMVGIFQPGPYLEGHLGHIHGGCIATIIDTTLGTGVIFSCGMAMTANLSIVYHSPILLGSTVLADCRVDKVEGRKIYASCQLRSHDGAVLYNEAKGLYIKKAVGDFEPKL